MRLREKKNREDGLQPQQWCAIVQEKNNKKSWEPQVGPVKEDDRSSALRDGRSL